jgi:hypothetical protein
MCISGNLGLADIPVNMHLRFKEVIIIIIKDSLSLFSLYKVLLLWALLRKPVR